MSPVLPTLAVLRGLEPFSVLSESELTGLIPALQRKWYARRACVVRPGDGARGLYAVLSGAVKFAMEDGEGRQVTLATSAKGDFFTELDLNDAAAQELSVVALQPCEIVHLAAREFRRCMDENSRFARAVTDKLSGRLGCAYAQIAKLAFLGVRERVAQALLESATPQNGAWAVDQGSEELARRVGASREMVSRVLKQMREEGLIHRQSRRTTILDRERLSA